ncbi:hypothetical protein GKZ90_0021165 [Flavobacterium sp. MC2016-06]|uniref:hypothetical protein n=1 Tax=Flavobacterium sp. MC2016-06 TaxID=2676308 RepID=UPI0012BB03DF|nr:hypothetical protein [Flavobacterium sp. MC2016-06]MBU3861012.1 hypothetical protein [Flavobacterium sp. MC2016-06]
MKIQRFNKNGLVTYIKNEHNKIIRVRYYKYEIVMYFETNIVYRYKFRYGTCIENKYINEKLVATTVYENKDRETIISEIQASHAPKNETKLERTKPEKQRLFVDTIKLFFHTI